MASFEPFVATDKFSMQTFNNKLNEIVTDFNADNAKIEAALGELGGAMPIQFLRETVVTEETDRVSVSVTAEELAKYPRLLVFAKLSCASTDSNETELVFNYGNTGTYDYNYVSTGADTNQAYISGWTWDYCSCWVDVYGAANGYACAYMRGSLSSNNMYGGRIGVFGFSKSILYDDITTIDFIAKPGTTGNIATMGSAMRLYGCTYGIK